MISLYYIIFCQISTVCYYLRHRIINVSLACAGYHRSTRMIYAYTKHKYFVGTVSMVSKYGKYEETEYQSLVSL